MTTAAYSNDTIVANLDESELIALADQLGTDWPTIDAILTAIAPRQFRVHVGDIQRQLRNPCIEVSRMLAIKGCAK